MLDVRAMRGDRPFRRRRERPLLVCHECHRRKLKCNKRLPCDRCSKAKPPRNCVFDDAAAETNESRELRQPRTIQFHSPNQNEYNFEPSPSGTEEVIRLGSPQISPGAYESSAFPETVVRRKEHDQNGPEIHVPTPKTTVVRDGEEHPVAVTKVARNAPKRNWYGRSSVYWLFEKLEHITIPLSQAGFIERDGNFTFYSDVKEQLFRRRLIISEDLEETQRSVFEEVPDKDTANKLIRSYFDTYGSVFLFLDQASFEAEVQQSWASPENVSLAFCIHLLLVIAVGNSTIHSTLGRLPLAKITTWWHLIQAWQNITLRSNPCDIKILQTSCLISLMRQSYSLEASANWPSSGALVRNAMLAGLHRDPSSTGQQFSPDEVKIYQHLWYVILELDLQSSMDEGMQPTLVPGDWDMPLPKTPSADTETLEGSQNIPLPVSSLISTLPVRVEIAHFLNNAKSSTSYEEALILHQQLGSAAQSLLSPDFCHHPSHTTFMHGLATILCKRSLLALHIPFASLKVPSSAYAHNICTITALSLLDRLNPSSDQNKWPDTDPLTVMMRSSSSIFQTIALQAVLLICVQLESHMVDPQPWTLVTELKDRYGKTFERYLVIAEQRLLTQDFVGKAYMIPAMVLKHMRLATLGKSRDEIAVDDSVIAEEVAKKCFNIFRNRSGLPSG